MSQGISLANAEKAAAKVSVLVSMLAPRPSMATAPRGSGVVMMPAMVDRKMASRCQALSATPAGGGMTHSAAPSATQMPSFFRSAPHLMPAAAMAAGSSVIRRSSTRQRAQASGVFWMRSERLSGGGRRAGKHAAAAAAGPPPTGAPAAVPGSPWGATGAGVAALALTPTTSRRAGSRGAAGARCSGLVRLGRAMAAPMAPRHAVGLATSEKRA